MVGLAIKIAFGKPFKGLISLSCSIWKPSFVLVRQINCINLQNGRKCHPSSFKSAMGKKGTLQRGSIYPPVSVEIGVIGDLTYKF